MKQFLALAVALFAVTSAVAQVQLAPVGRWRVQESADACGAERDPSPGDQVLTIEQGDKGDLRLLTRTAGPALTPFEAYSSTLLVGDEAMEVEATALPEEENGPARLLGLHVPPPSLLASMRQVSAIRVRTGEHVDELATPDLLPAIDAIARCVRMRQDRAERETAAWATFEAMPPPTTAVTGPPIGQWFGSDDYPAFAAALDQQGDVGIAMLVGADGRVAACQVTGSSGYPLLDWQTCAVMRSRARLQPAKDARGKARLGKAVGRILWRLPDE